MAQTKMKQWWISLISGVIFMIIGIWIMIAQIESYGNLAGLLVTGFAIVGLLRSYYALRNKKELEYWPLILINGLLEIGIVFIPIFFSEANSILPIYVGFILLFRSILGIGISLNFYYSHYAGWIVIFLASILGIIASFLMIWRPVSLKYAVLVFPALTLFFVGISQFGIAMGLKKLNSKFRENIITD